MSEEIRPRMRVTLNVSKAREAGLFVWSKSYLLREAGTVVAEVEPGIVKVLWDRMKSLEEIWVGYLSPLSHHRSQKRHRGERR